MELYEIVDPFRLRDRWKIHDFILLDLSQLDLFLYILYYLLKIIIVSCYFCSCFHTVIIRTWGRRVRASKRCLKKNVNNY